MNMSQGLECMKFYLHAPKCLNGMVLQNVYPTLSVSETETLLTYTIIYISSLTQNESYLIY
jgi:hypothetical protein